MKSLSPRLARQLPLLSLLLLTPPLLTGCASNPWPAEIVQVQPKTPANPYKYLTWSRRDTPDTIQQIRRHNALHGRMTEAAR